MLLWLLCVVLVYSVPSFKSHADFNADITLVVGPGCRPPPLNAASSLTARAAAKLSTDEPPLPEACVATDARGVLGPIVSPANFPDMLSPQSPNPDTGKKGEGEPVFHWVVTATTRNQTCRERVSASP